MAEDVQKTIQEFSTIQQQLQMVMAQRQQLDAQIKENETSAAELEKSSGQAFRFVGSVMIQQDKTTIKKDLAQELDELKGKVEFLERSEKKMAERFTTARKKLEELAKAQKASGAI